MCLHALALTCEQDDLGDRLVAAGVSLVSFYGTTGASAFFFGLSCQITHVLCELLSSSVCTITWPNLFSSRQKLALSSPLAETVKSIQPGTGCVSKAPLQTSLSWRLKDPTHLRLS